MRCGDRRYTWAVGLSSDLVFGHSMSVALFKKKSCPVTPSDFDETVYKLRCNEHIQTVFKI